MPGKTETPPTAGETKPAVEAKPEGAKRQTPHAWGEEFGLTERADPARPWVEPHANWKFAAADKCHGWTDHARAYQAPGQELLLTREDFDKALEAGAAYPERPAHGPACGKGFEDRALTKKQLEAKAKEEAAKAEVTTNG